MSTIIKESSMMLSRLEHEEEDAITAAVSARALGWEIMEKMCMNTAHHYRQKADALRAKVERWKADDACARGVYVNQD